ncbi:ATP-binding cassette domain-containing protein [Sinirhodobacter sp. WL0062]|uniref:ATP-binding cassette domain-containing protein n=1 Tax=Rhodobacter flavimaris TaxID=2907145 RepID=A0ABS8YXM3_9RHOB|nr:ATP-binding cassette domain-containing protein [Sinirhodobacter sp. WL0062]MCE5973196.1 ATP-binding cassette domain-containing protein [Sinirhodobacter sp. WL0062]
MHGLEPSGALRLAVRDLHKSYGSLEVLRGISLEAHQGDVIALIGASGSGKSTFLRCINQLEDCSQGEIFVNGEHLDLVHRKGRRVARDPRQLRRIRSKLGFVFQSFNLWSHMTVLENLIEGPTRIHGMHRDEAVALAQSLLERVGMKGREGAYPAQLSGGQQQRIAIARALAMQPEVMLFDEPTSALDPELVAEVLAVIRDLATEGRTMLLVTHEMAFARDVASKVVFLHKGLVEESGPPAEIFGAPKSVRLTQFLKHVRLN